MLGLALVAVPRQHPWPLRATALPSRFVHAEHEKPEDGRCCHEEADRGTALIHLKNRSEVLPVSRSYLYLFRQM